MPVLNKVSRIVVLILLPCVCHASTFGTYDRSEEPAETAVDDEQHEPSHHQAWHTGLYEIEDVLDLLDAQSQQNEHTSCRIAGAHPTYHRPLAALFECGPRRFQYPAQPGKPMRLFAGMIDETGWRIAPLGAPFFIDTFIGGRLPTYQMRIEALPVDARFDLDPKAVTWRLSEHIASADALLRCEHDTICFEQEREHYMVRHRMHDITPSYEDVRHHSIVLRHERVALGGPKSKHIEHEVFEMGGDEVVVISRLRHRNGATWSTLEQKSALLHIDAVPMLWRGATDTPGRVGWSQ